MKSTAIDCSSLREVLVTASAGLLFAIAANPASGADWAASLQNLTPVQGRTLLALARDFFQHPELSDSHYTVCIDPYDTAAADPQAKASLEESMELVKGASRRMGYDSYAEISDEYERLRLSKMLAEGRWLRQFKKSVGQCLYDQPDVKTRLNRN
ncbi:MAG: hypothetical protein ACREU7_11495 [Burkholderiales bacterium]